MTVDLSRWKELGADPKPIQEIIRWTIKKLDNNYNAADAGIDQSMFFLTVLEKNQRNELKIFSRKCNSIIKDEKLARSKK